MRKNHYVYMPEFLTMVCPRQGSNRRGCDLGVCLFSSEILKRMCLFYTLFWYFFEMNAAVRPVMQKLTRESRIHTIDIKVHVWVSNLIFAPYIIMHLLH